MTEPRARELDVTPRMPQALPRLRAAIVPGNSIAGRALVAVVAIMTFLASMTTGAVVLVRGAASDWQAEVAREITIQVRPQGGRHRPRRAWRVGGTALYERGIEPAAGALARKWTGARRFAGASHGSGQDGAGRAAARYCCSAQEPG